MVMEAVRRMAGKSWCQGGLRKTEGEAVVCAGGEERKKRRRRRRG